MKPKLLIPLALLVLAVGLAACGGSSSSSSEAETGAPPSEESTTGGESTESEPAPSGEARKAEKVEIVEYTFQPDPVVIQEGGKVTWQNEDTASHTATADDGSFETGIIEHNKTKSETFKTPGTFTYYCKIHPTMHGTIEVVPKN